MKEGFRVERNPSFCITGADSGFRRTNGFHPRLRVSARIRFAVRSLSEASDREINKVRRPGWHLIHRKRSPFPSIGEGLKAPDTGECSPISGAAIDY